MKLQKKLVILLAVIASPLLVSCTQNMSVYNPAIQKLASNAEMYMNEGKIDDAILRLIAINDLNENLVKNNYNLGIAYYKKEDYEMSIRSLNKAIELNPDFLDAHYSLAVVYEELAMQSIEEIEEQKDKDSKENLTDEDISQNIENSIKHFEIYKNKANNTEEIEKVSTKIDLLNNELEKYASEKE